ncbi:hypothetical protein HHL22_20780 [Hymenobacter sp. RP-2-7]|uniref:XRE family transcriptional regulator n=1 Tax=Hymenobacter polaris TaxID=2682546 RepID=A0A7Y0AI09_9BACT|nr:hypothetical protein [Hymenobacter polaris]NML67644.1 hypothetical protein [Hymenobacter polaris]
MLTAPATPLPAYDQAQVDKRFLVELDRLLQAGAFTSYREWGLTLGVNPNYVAAIAAGRYHCNLKLLYDTVRHFPGCDFNYVVFGSAIYARPEPKEAPKRALGRRTKAPIST